MFSLASCATNHRLTQMGIYQQVSPMVYSEYLKQDVNIIDVRTKSEFRKTHIERAINASYLSGHFSEIVSSSQLDKAKPTLIYCETQHRSPLAANKLYKMGFKDIIDLDKGMFKWRKRGFPFVKGD